MNVIEPVKRGHRAPIVTTCRSSIGRSSKRDLEGINDAPVLAQSDVEDRDRRRDGHSHPASDVDAEHAWRRYGIRAVAGDDLAADHTPIAIQFAQNLRLVRATPLQTKGATDCILLPEKRTSAHEHTQPDPDMR